MVTGESAEYAVKPLRREGRVFSADLWFCRVLFLVPADLGCQPVPGLPCALSFIGEVGYRKARARSAPRERAALPIKLFDMRRGTTTE
jgi:hypothetical protein